ncbi:MAG: peptidylprolyl isomerase [Pseudomonadota bacterium]
MIRFVTVAVLFLTIWAGALFAQSPENILVIEIEGQANGRVEIELLPDVAPEHVARIKRLAREGYYNNIAFHRVIGGFMAQTGDVKFGKRETFLPRYAGQGGSIYPDLRAEFSDLSFQTGVVGMARGQDEDSANSQFFITLGDASFLDGAYTIFGRVIEGMNVVSNIKFNETIQEIRAASQAGRQHANGAVGTPDFMTRVFVKADE